MILLELPYCSIGIEQAFTEVVQCRAVRCCDSTTMLQMCSGLLMDLDWLQDIEMEQDGKHFIVRTPVSGDVGRVFQAVGPALPPNTTHLSI